MDGVLVDYEPAVRVATIASAIGRMPSEVHAAIYESGIETAGDMGRLGADAYLDALGRQLGTPLPEAAWVEGRKRATRARGWAIDLAGSLVTTCGVAVLTNNGHLLARHWPAIVPDFFPLFTARALVAADFGAAKPEPSVYRAALAHLGWLAGETLFIDDVAVNVDGAVEAGLSGHVFTGEREMRLAICRFVGTIR